MLAAHAHDEVRVSGEQRLLSLGVPPVRAMRVGVDEFADREAVGLLGRRDLSGGRHGPLHLAVVGVNLAVPGSSPDSRRV